MHIRIIQHIHIPSHYLHNGHSLYGYTIRPRRLYGWVYGAFFSTLGGVKNCHIHKKICKKYLFIHIYVNKSLAGEFCIKWSRVNVDFMHMDLNYRYQYIYICPIGNGWDPI